MSDGYWERQRPNDRVNEQFSDYVCGESGIPAGTERSTSSPLGYTTGWVINRGNLS